MYLLQHLFNTKTPQIVGIRVVPTQLASREASTGLGLPARCRHGDRSM
jgi:hypothetical protein